MNRGFRFYVYTAALVALLIFLAGSTLAIWQFVTGESPLVGAVAAAAGLIGWGVHWWLAGRAARPMTMAAAAERSATARKAYLALGQLVALAATATQALLAVRLALLRLLDGAVSAAGPSIIALAAGAVVALLVWGFVRWTAVRDGDFGRELSRGAAWRRAYLYLAALTGSVLAAGGGWLALNAVIARLWQPLAEVGGWRVPVAEGLAALVVGGPLALFAWDRADRQAAAAPAAEVNALSRVLLHYAGLLLGTLGTLTSAIYLVGQAVLWTIGQEGPLVGNTGLARVVTGPHMLALLPVAVVAWLTNAGGLRRDAMLAAESARSASLRRLARYTVAGLTLAALWFGLTEVARLVLQVVLDRPAAALAFAAGGWGRFAAATALVVVAAPAWWGHWWSQQVRARAPFPPGYAERTSTIRRIYLGIVIVVAAIIVVATLGFAAFLALNWTAASNASAVRAAIAGAAGATAVAFVWLISHAFVWRGDARWLASDQAALAANAAAAEPTTPSVPGEHATDSTAIAPIAPAGPKRYLREELAAVAAQVGIATPVERLAPRPLAVIDGADGAIGAALLAALRQALPDVPLWPIGLNAAAQVAMLNALGEGTPPAVPPDAVDRVAAILGPADILTPDGLDGEVPAELAAALAASPARLLLLPPRSPRLRWVAAPDWPLARWVENAVIEATDVLQTP